MREFVGVKSPLDLILEMQLRGATIDSLFKHEALMFDRISCPLFKDISSSFAPLGVEPLDELATHIDYIEEQGLLYPAIPNAEGAQLGLLETDSEFQTLKVVEPALEQLLRMSMGAIEEAGLSDLMDGRAIEPDKLNGYLEKMRPEVAIPFVAAFQYQVRRLSVQLRVVNGVEARPVLSDVVPQLPLQHSEKSEAVSLTFNALPSPDESVSWEQIIEYRSDPDSRSKFLALRHWMSEVARAELTPAEVEEKLEYLIDQYQKHMRLHRMKTNVGTLETIITTGAEFLGDLVSFKWGKAAEALFSLKRRQVALLEGELTAPGNEVAYIVKARETFGN